MNGKDRRPSPALIITGLVIGLIIVIIAVVYFFNGSTISSIVIGQPEKNIDGIEFDIFTAMNGVSRYNDNVNVEIYFKDMETPVYEGKASITDDSGSHSVDYEDFIWGNGEYHIHAKKDGHSDIYTFTIRSVADEIVPEWRGYNADSTRLNHDYKVEATIGYGFGGSRSPSSEDPQRYSFNGTLTAPDGKEYIIDSDDYPSNLLKLSKAIEHQERGTYRLEGTVTNEFCNPNSPYRKVHVEEESTYLFDAAPFADAGEDINTELVEGQATVTLDATDSWDDSGIKEYKWYIGDLTVETTSSPTITYTFTTTGTYYVALEVIDNQGNSSMENAEVSTITILVT
jgi:hypothetical protein